MKLVPSDKDIGEILNLSPSKVRYYLRKNYRIYNIKQKKVAKEKISAK